MPKARGKAKRRPPAQVEEAASDRITYRDLRNTPGRVWQRLALDRPLTLVADGRARALLIPILDGDAATANEAYLRGRALLAVRRIQDGARQSGPGAMTLDEINRIIRDVRTELREREPSGD